MLPRQGINTTFDPVSPRPGSIAFISQSGAIITTIVDWSLPEEIGFSAVIPAGNPLDLTFEDFIRWAAACAQIHRMGWSEDFYPGIVSRDLTQVFW